MSVTGWKIKKHAVCAQWNNIQPQQEGKSVTHNINESGGYYIKWNKSSTDKYHMIYHVDFKTSGLIEIKYRMMITKH